MSQNAIPVFLIESSTPTNEAVRTDLSEVLSEIPAKVVATLEETQAGEALALSNGLLNLSPEHLDFLLEGLEEYDLLIQPSITGKVLGLAYDGSNDDALSIVRLLVETPEIDLFDFAKASLGKGLEHCIHPPWYGLIDGEVGLRFAYQHMLASALHPESEPLAIRTLDWLRKDAGNA